MKKNDLNLFKGEIKNAIQAWGDSKIDSIFPDKPAAKSFFKNGFHNLLAKEDERINKYLDMAFLFVADEQGVIDSDVLIENINSIFKEMEVKEYDFRGFHASVGRGEITIGFPQNFLLDMIFSGGSLRFTTDDINDLKSFLS